MKPKMKSLSIALAVSAIGLAFVPASPAEAAKAKHKRAGAAVQVTQPRQTAAIIAAAGTGFQSGVRAGPLYNGQDYIGDDPDPNIRAYLIRDMTRYRGSY